MAKKRKKKQLDNIVPYSDIGTPELRQHYQIEVIGHGRGQRAYNRTQTPLDYYVTRGYIVRLQYDAAMRWRSDFYVAGLSPHKGITYDRIAKMPTSHLTDRQVEAYKNFRAATYKLGPRDKDVLFAICCLDEYMSAVIGKEGGRDLTSMMGALRECLNVLARYYGFFNHV